MANFPQTGRLAAPEDNCAIAIRQLASGTAVDIEQTTFTLSHTILEGHRFAIRPIPKNTQLLSWGQPFGRALRDIHPGEYVCNERVLHALNGRRLKFPLPTTPNFADDLATYQFDPTQFQPAPPLPSTANPTTFMGFRRAGNRGVGTRNIIVLLGVNALVSGFTKRLEKELRPLARQYSNIDDIVAVTHTEGSQRGNNNEQLLLRTLSSWMVHPNVAAVLVLDAGEIGVTNTILQHYAQQHGYPLHDVLHQFVSLHGPFEHDLAQTTTIIKSWLAEANTTYQRTPQPLSELKIALQCGGSDAFSGISGNPVAAWVSKAVIQAGGAAVLAETDELIGAEAYVLQKVRHAHTAERFLHMLKRFQERTAWHGHSAHSNPSGGNLFRGLYNIYLKSLGAATKRHPDVPLDGVLEYGERMSEPGYFFMDSPGNDLESIAGQVATGCNMIFFVTGNGSITNFPFVPTVKIVTTSERYAMLTAEMDVNAGAYLDGTPLEQVGQETLDLTVAIASGQRSVGEDAQHAQVQLWRNWQLTTKVDLEKIYTQPQPDGQPLPISSPTNQLMLPFAAWQTENNITPDRIGLILPSSLCSGQIAQMAADRLNQQSIGRDQQISRFVSLVHTEGCGVSTQAEYVDTLLGYLAHPLVATCLVLEHGCEITHNDFWRGRMTNRGLDPQTYGWASVQLDGGIETVLAKIEQWFTTHCATQSPPQAITANLSNVQLGVMSDSQHVEIEKETAAALAQLIQQITAAGGTAILPANDPLAADTTFTNTLGIPTNNQPTLAYAHQPQQAGFHLMANPSTQWTETMSGLGATGVTLLLTLVHTRLRSSHPLIPVLQLTTETAPPTLHPDVDVVLVGNPAAQLQQLLPSLTAVLSRQKTPKSTQANHVDFQITRGRLGVSL